jgi:transcriptional regulator with XRE-family HTH domain
MITEDIYMALQDVIIGIRKQNDLSQEDLADKLFVTRQAVSRWENGETTPTLDTLKAIATQFNVDARSLLGLPETSICQSCAMPLQSLNDFGTNGDGTASTEYCSHCYGDGSFTHSRTIEEMVESNLRFLDEFNAQNGTDYSEDEARTILKMHLATLKRWQTA